MTAGGKGAGMGAEVVRAHGHHADCSCCLRIVAALEAAGYGDTTEVRRYAEMMRDSISVDRAEMADDILAILDGTLTARAEQQAHSGGGES